MIIERLYKSNNYFYKKQQEQNNKSKKKDNATKTFSDIMKEIKKEVDYNGRIK